MRLPVNSIFSPILKRRKTVGNGHFKYLDQPLVHPRISEHLLQCPNPDDKKFEELYPKIGVILGTGAQVLSAAVREIVDDGHPSAVPDQ
jgi:hypothetical protein